MIPLEISKGVEIICKHNFPYITIMIEFSATIPECEKNIGHIKRILFHQNIFSIFQVLEIHLPVWLRKRLISGGLEPVLSHTEKSCISSNYRQFPQILKYK